MALLPSSRSLSRDGSRQAVSSIPPVPRWASYQCRLTMCRVSRSFLALRLLSYRHLRVVGPIPLIPGNVPSSRNIAYTNLHLGLHMDLLTSTTRPSQVLHYLRNKVHGGTSGFVDALHATATLGGCAPAQFEVLATTRVPFHFINDGHHLHCAHLAIERSAAGAIHHINYSPSFQVPLFLDTPPSFYPAPHVPGHPRAHVPAHPARGRRRHILQPPRFARPDGVQRHRGAGSGGGVESLAGCYFEADALLDRGRGLIPYDTSTM
ncbi:hypothetical protein C8J57DRAFT_1722455 [Mycena rebaudengoi]|nr:hypothetical protein C8J57DRAFT_1722455 [Mycena rebaudengoi]